MQRNCPSLDASVLVLVSLKDLRCDALLPQSLGQSQAREARAKNEHVRFV